MASLALAAGLALSSCDAPQVEAAAEFLDSIYLPLEGNTEVALTILPSVYFSDELDGATITADTVLLESTTPAADDEGSLAGGCLDLRSRKPTLRQKAGAGWSAVSGTPRIDPGNARRVVFTPDGNKLSPSTCYRMSFLTGVSGKKAGPLQQGFVLRDGFGIEMVFFTRAQ